VSSPFAILSVDIGQIKFPQKVAEAIQAKIAATERLKKQEFVLEKTKKEAAISVLEALKVAKQQRIISETLDPLYVQRKAVQVYKRLGSAQNSTIFVLPNSTEGTGLPLVMSRGKPKTLTDADKELLSEMEAKYMELARTAGGQHSDGSLDTPAAPAPTPTDAPAPPAGDAPAPAGQGAPAAPAAPTPAAP